MGPKKNWGKRNFGPKRFGPNKFSPPKILGPNVPLAYGIPRNLPLKVGQNWRSNS